MRLFQILAVSVVVSTTLVGSVTAGKIKVKDTSFGWNVVTQSIPSFGTTAEAQFPAVAVNQAISVKFNTKLKKKTVDGARVFVTSIGATVLTPLGLSSSIPGGQVVPVSLKVSGSGVTLMPAVLFSGNSVSFGFAANAYYQLELKGGGGGIRGKKGGKLKSSVIIRFRTTDVVADFSAGPPEAKVFVVDSSEGSVSLQKTSTVLPTSSFNQTEPNPSPQVRIKFDDLILPSTLLNPATGSSPGIEIHLDQDDNNATSSDRLLVPGTFVISNSNYKTTLDWFPTLTSIPPNKMYLVTVSPLVEDLVGNSVFAQTGDIGAVDVFGFRTLNKPPGELVPIEEHFNSILNRDDEATSADWADSTLGILQNGNGGGTGVDGDFDPASNTVLATGEFDPGLGAEVQKIWNFRRFEIDSGITVTASGDFPLVVRATGPVTVSGTLDVSGETPTSFSVIQVEPGEGGVGSLGGASGGRGGSVTDGVDLSTALFGNVTGYGAANTVNQGLTGRSVVIDDYQFQSEVGSPPFTVGYQGLWFQPNTGTGSSEASASPGPQIVHNHPSFKIETFLNSLLLRVVDGSFEADYQGTLTQPSLDLYELPPPPIAKPFDPYIIGDLKGHDGEPAGFADSSGVGSMPMTVAQAFITQVRSGGGAGGAGRADGEDGEDSPPAGLFGENTGTDGGVAGDGYPSLPAQSMTDTVITLVGTPLEGINLSLLGSGWIVFPNEADHYMFDIVSNTDSSITIKPVNLLVDTVIDTNDDDVYDLLDCTLGATCRVEPSFSVGGAGGSGSGVHCAGTTKLSGPPNLTLPIWTPGAGAGSGGGAVSIESAKRITVQATGQILARGGDGGRSSGSIGSSASGGGAGAGGGIVLKSADPSNFAVLVVGTVDSTGGSGGLGFVEGGDGGDGRFRAESALGNLNPASFSTPQVEPAVLPTDLGMFIPGLSATVGQSEFYWTETLSAVYTGFTVEYDAVVDGVPQTDLTYTYSDFVLGTPAPFVIEFNAAFMNSSGSIDESSITEVFVEDLGTLIGPFVRFRITLEGEVMVGASTYGSVQVDSVTIDFAG